MLDQVRNIIGLFCGIVLRIDDFNIDSEFFCFFFNAFTYGYEEGVVECGDGEADGSCFFPSAGFAALSLLPQPEVSTASTVMAATKRVQIFFIGECLLSFLAVHKYRQ